VSYSHCVAQIWSVASVDEDDGNDGEPIDYDYTAEELNSTSANLSIRQQIVSFTPVQ
jgi:hypothetical protein